MKKCCDTCTHGKKRVNQLPCRDCFNTKHWEPMTNAQKIRAMSDEELEQAIGGCGLCGYIQDHDQQWCDDMPDCSNCVVQWLKSPVKDGAE